MTHESPTSAVPSPTPGAGEEARRAAAAPGTSEHELREATMAALGTVWDPELGIDIVSMGLVYDVRVSDRIEIDMTLTTPGCPVSEQLPTEARAAVAAALPDVGVAVQVVWDPPWTPELLSSVGLERLGLRRRR